MASAKPDSEKSEYTVARGRTVHVDGKAIGPGQPVSLSASDAEHLIKTGFLIVPAATADSDQPAFGVQVGGLQIKGGRKPGGVVV